MSAGHQPLAYRHVDVFSNTSFSGNGLTVFPASGDLSVEGENRQQAQWLFHLRVGTVAVTTQRQEGYYSATMNQGRPIFGEVASEQIQQQVLSALSLSTKALYENLPMQMVSTGLPYLLIILKKDLEKAQIIHPDFEGLLAQLGARFVYVFHLPTMEGRSWDNRGRVEDIATGSAAGPLGAYLVKYGQAKAGTEIILHQGSFVGRPSHITVQVTGTAHTLSSVQVSGDVAMVAHGVIDAVI